MSDIMWDGVNLMIMGMGSVFVFLALLVLGIMIMSKILMRFPEVEIAARPQNRTSDEEMAEVAAVAAAVKLVHQR
ncbi:OadG family protein [Reinekea sp.]|jgi:oxaloacetate decarboxylase gamma subunit|uniref:OadG family protein n=1 Tax=Reinekea sp. TaxID=1970455 RepID=UPI003989CC29